MIGPKRWAVIAGLALGCLTLAGCAAGKAVLAKREAAQEQRERNAETVRSFEQQRESAEFQAAESLWSEGRHEECRRRLLAILEQNPNHLDAQLLLVDVLLAENRPQEALEVLQPALQAHPNDARVQYGMALLLDATGQRAGAEAYYEGALRLAPDNEVYQVSYEQVVAADASATVAFVPPAPTEYAGSAEPADSAVPVDVEAPPTTATPGGVLQQGCDAIAQGNTETGRASFKRAMADKPDDPQIPITAAIAALRSNHPEVAIDVLEPAARQFPRSAVIQRILGTAYYRQGDYRSSQVALQQALSLDKSNALSYFLLGCTQVKLGVTDAAERCFRQAQLLDPKYTVQR